MHREESEFRIGAWTRDAGREQEEPFLGLNQFIGLVGLKGAARQNPLSLKVTETRTNP
jgi:hypothetical protein